MALPSGLGCAQRTKCCPCPITMEALRCMGRAELADVWKAPVLGTNDTSQGRKAEVCPA